MMNGDGERSTVATSLGGSVARSKVKGQSSGQF